MNAVATIQPTTEQLPATVNDGAALLNAIAKAASDPSVDVVKMKALMEMHNEMRLHQAQMAFNEAMARIQAKMRRIGTDKTNSQTHSDYATYGKLDRALRPLYTEEGFALSFGTEEAPAAEMVRVVCHVTHRDGFTRKHMIDMPADGKGAKGNDVMTKTHATGSATQYGMRYLLKMIFNVAIGDDPDDDDGNAAHQPEPDHLDWKAAIAGESTVDGMKGLKRELESKFGDAIPLVLVDLCNARMAEIKGAAK